MRGVRSGWLPKTFVVLRGLPATQLVTDLQAGIVVGIVAIPLALAFAIASGVPPEQGLITAVVGGFSSRSLGGSRVQIGGPTGAFVVIVYGIVQRYGLDGLTICTVLAGDPPRRDGPRALRRRDQVHPLSRRHRLHERDRRHHLLVPDQGPARPEDGRRPGAVRREVAGLRRAPRHGVARRRRRLGVRRSLILLVWPKVSRKIPAPIVAILLAVGRRGGLRACPSRRSDRASARFTPRCRRRRCRRSPSSGCASSFSPAVTVALLAAIESLLSAVVADGMIGSRHKSNVELVAQGIANIASGLFGGIPATGAIARTATNVKNGGRTPVAGMIHAVTVLLVLVFLGKWARYIPMATLAAILAVVAYHMSEWRAFAHLFKTPKSDVAVLLTTFLLTVLDRPDRRGPGRRRARRVPLHQAHGGRDERRRRDAGADRRAGRDDERRHRGRRPAAHPGRRRGVRGERALLLRRRRQDQGRPPLRREEAARVHPADAQRAGDRRVRHPRARRPLPVVPAPGHPVRDRRDPRAAARRARPRREARRVRAGEHRGDPRRGARRGGRRGRGERGRGVPERVARRGAARAPRRGDGSRVPRRGALVAARPRDGRHAHDGVPVARRRAGGRDATRGGDDVQVGGRGLSRAAAARR